MTRLMGALAGLGVTLLTLSARADPNDSDYGWRRRFELEQPSIIRYVEGMPIPPGYERETHYDGRLVAVGALNFAGGYLIGVGTTALLERTEPVNFVPCVGPFIATSSRDDDPDEEGTVADLFGVVLGAMACGLELAGGVQIASAFVDSKPVLVRRVALVPQLHDSKASVHARVTF